MLVTSRKPDICRNKLFGISLTLRQSFSLATVSARKICFRAFVGESFTGRRISVENRNFQIHEKEATKDWRKKKRSRMQLYVWTIVFSEISRLHSEWRYTDTSPYLTFPWEYSECFEYFFFITFTLRFGWLFISTLTLYSSREQISNVSFINELFSRCQNWSFFISLYQFCVFTSTYSLSFPRYQRWIPRDGKRHSRFRAGRFS